VTDLPQPGIQRIVEVASRKGITLDIRHGLHSTHNADETAAALGVEVGQIVETRVFVATRGVGRLVPVICLISGCNQVDLSRLAAVIGEATVREATIREARDLMGYAAADMPPFGHGREVPIVMDQDLSQYEWVWAATGTPEAIFRVEPRTLRVLSNALVAPVARTSWIGGANVGTARREPRLPLAAATGA
jgi:prolyl-tRNA editing enzyme YbaK/EbsC (Cys-tRNA(Pro) deacylase)